MKSFRRYKTKEEYLEDKIVWNSIRPNVCQVDNFDGETKILFNKSIGLYDILWSKNDNPSEKLVTYEVLKPSEGYTPIALRVIGEEFLGKGEPSRWMSLKYMYFDNMNTTETGTRPFEENAINGSVTAIGMTWDETSKYVPKMKDESYLYDQDTLNNSRFKGDWDNIEYLWSDISFVDDDPNAAFTNTSRLSKTIDWGYFPSDEFTNYFSGTSVGESFPSPEELFYEDYSRGWHNDALSNNRIMPSLYDSNNEWVVASNPAEFTYPTHSLTRIHGKKATNKIVSMYKDGDPISNDVSYVGKCDYQTRLEELKPFYCVSNYRTQGTNPGDWYLPAIGELVFLIPDLKLIRKRLNEISSLYPSHCMTNLSSSHFWSSSENYWAYAWYFNLAYGSAKSFGSKCYQRYAVAFLEFSE